MLPNFKKDEYLDSPPIEDLWTEKAKILIKEIENWVKHSLNPAVLGFRGNFRPLTQKRVPTYASKMKNKKIKIKIFFIKCHLFDFLMKIH